MWGWGNCLKHFKSGWNKKQGRRNKDFKKEGKLDQRVCALKRRMKPLYELYISPQSPYIGQSSNGGIFDFRISGQFFIKENCHNFRTSDDIDMKFGPVTKLFKRNKRTSKFFDDDVMSKNCDVIVIFSIYGQFGAIRKLDFGHMVCKTYVFINSNL